MANREPRHYDRGRHYPPGAYRELADLAETYDVPFETLTREFDRGMLIEEIRRRLERGIRFWKFHRGESTKLGAHDCWMVTADAERALPGIRKAVSEYGCLGIRRKARSRLGKSAAGTGYLWHRDDIEAVQRIRRKLGVSTAMALRVFSAVNAL